MFAFLKKLFGMVDANKDGQIDQKDVKIVVEKIEAKAEVAAAKVKAQGKKVAAKTARKSKPKA